MSYMAATFTRDFPVLPAGRRVQTLGAACAVDYQGAVHCQKRRPSIASRSEWPSHTRHCSGKHDNVVRLGATTDAAQVVCRLR